MAGPTLSSTHEDTWCRNNTTDSVTAIQITKRLAFDRSLSGRHVMAKSAFAKLGERDTPPEPIPFAPAAEPVREAARPGRSRNPGRVGFKTVIFYVPPAVSKAMKQLALDEDTTQQDLMVEAVGLLMKRRGRAVP